MSAGSSALGLAGIVFAIVVLVGITGFIGVDPGVEKVVVQRGELTGVLDEGWYWKNPITTDVHKVSVRPQIYVQSGQASEGETQGDDSIESKTVDGNVVFADIAIRYRVTDSRQFYLDWFHSQWGKDPFLKFEREKARSPSRDLTRDIIGTINSETVYTGEAQQQVEERLEDEMEAELSDSGATLVDVDVRNIRFSGPYQDTLEEKANSVQQRQIQTNLAEADAEAKVIRAKADAEAARIRAEGRKEADLTRAEGLTKEVITIRQIEGYSDANAVYVPVGNDGLPLYLNANRNATASGSSGDLFGEE